MADPILRHPLAALVIAAIITGAAGYAASTIEPRVDFVDTVPEHEGLGAYRALLQELDGVRFLAVYEAHDPSSGTDSLRGEAFDALVDSQGSWQEALEEVFPGAFTHHLSVYEAMKAGNHMLLKIATAGNPPPGSYSLPQDPATWEAVKQQVLGDDSTDDVLAPNGTSALSLHFLAGDADARALAPRMEALLQTWADTPGNAPVTHEHAPTGLVHASAYTDRINREETLRWAPIAALGAGLAILWAVRRLDNTLIAVTGMAVALTWTFGAMGALGVRISFLTVFLAPVVVGIGLDYAVHILQRYEEERRAGNARAAALDTAVRRTGPAVRLAAITTALGIGTLLLVPARLFAEIGGMAALGTVLGFVAAVTVVPALRAIIPDRRPRRARERVGPMLAHWATRVRRRPMAAIVVLVATTLVAGVVVATQTHFESGSAENEFPQDDPTIMLQHRIEQEYGAFQRGYLVVQGDLTDPEVLRAMHDATRTADTLPLYRDAAAITDLLLADEATDQGAADIALASLLAPTPAAPSDEERLPATAAEARDRLDALFEDPLWRTIAPFLISRDYDLAVVAVTFDPWQDQEALRDLRDALRAQAVVLQEAAGPSYDVAAAGAPVNRAAVVDQTPWDVAVVTLGATLVVFASLAVAWRRRPGGVRMAAVGATVVLLAALWLLAGVAALDAFYAWTHEAFGWARNTAAVTDMFLLAFAVTVAVGIDDAVHIIHRYWDAREHAGRDDAVRAAFQGAGRAITGTTLTTVVAFALMGGVYFLQSKNLAILTALGVAFAYAITLLLMPWALRQEA